MKIAVDLFGLDKTNLLLLHLNIILKDRLNETDLASHRIAR